MSNYRNVTVLIVAIGLMQIGGGILGVVTPLGLAGLGLSEELIGAVAALYAAGFMAGAWTAPRVIAAVGHIRTYAAAAGVVAIGAMLMGLEPNVWLWTLVRFAQGLGMAWMFASAESWMSSSTPAEWRGRVLGLYHVIAKAALLAGPFLVAGISALAPEPWFWIAIFTTLGLIPICLTRQGEPARPGKRAMGPLKILKIAPAALWGTFFAGVINTGTLALLPVYSQELNTGDGEGAGISIAAVAMAAAWIGGVVSQWPMGRLSDLVDRRLVIAGMGLVSGSAALALGLFGAGLALWPVMGLLAVWGAGSLSFYGVAVAHGVDRTEASESAPLMSGLLFVWAAGSVIGPPLAGFSFRLIEGGGGLFVFAAVLAGCLTLAMLWRTGQRPQASQEDRESFEIAQPTSVAHAEIDPRGEPPVDAPESPEDRP